MWLGVDYHEYTNMFCFDKARFTMVAHKCKYMGMGLFIYLSHDVPNRCVDRAKASITIAREQDHIDGYSLIIYIISMCLTIVCR